MEILETNELFTGREYFLELFRKNKENLKKGHISHSAIIGNRNIGKTSTIKQIILKNKDIKNVYVDLEKISLSPESFSVEFIEKCVSQIKNEKLTFEEILKLKFPGLSIVKEIKNELEKIKPNQQKLIEWSFSFLDKWAQEDDFHCMLFLDEFHKILEFNNFLQIKDILSIINLNWKKTNLVCSSSAKYEMTTISQKLKLKTETMNEFDRETVKQLTNKFKITGEKEVDRIYALSNGIPMFTLAICNKYKELKSVDKAYIHEVLNEQGIIYNALRFSLHENLSRARGQTLLFNILKVLAQNKPLRLTEIASKIYRSGPVTKSLVDRLLEVDLISKNDKYFSISEEVMQFYIYHVLVLDSKNISKEELK